MKDIFLNPVFHSCRGLKKYSFAELPSTIPWSSIKDMLNRVNRTTPMGRRDYAILMLFITYGLRASEVAGLRLENIDWRRKVICVHQQKSRTILELPLTGEVATALVDYLRQGTSANYVSTNFHYLSGSIAPHNSLYCLSYCQKTH